jgi:hypothetical protein
MKSALGCLIAVTMLWATLCSAQFTPVVAKQRMVEDVLDENGNVLRHDETLGTYMRNSRGATLTQTFSVMNGKRTLESGQLADFDRHKMYALDYQRHEAVGRMDLPNKPSPDYMRNTKNSLGEETINGIHCVIGPMVQVMADGTKQPIGRAWNSPEYGLSIKRDSIVEPRGSSRIHQIVELYDISFVEPDPNEFDLDKNFSVLQKKSAQECDKPGAPSALSDPIK